jgi:alanine racemase
MKCTSEILLSKSALKANLDLVKDLYCNQTRISSVVKANAYGHGISTYVPMAEDLGIDHFAVFSYDEALEVLDVVKKADIMIMGWVDDDCLKDVIKKGIEFFVFEMQRLEQTIEFAKELNIKAKIHLEVETGMNRSGIPRKSIQKAIKLIRENQDYIEFTGLCSHLAGPESIANYVRIKNQLKSFYKIYHKFTNAELVPEYQHIANSAALITLPRARMNMVRLGITQYGFWPSKEVFISYARTHDENIEPLKRVITWKTKIMSVKKVKAGEFVGYGTSYLASNDMTIGLIPVGYSHAFSRGLSNRGRVIVHGRRCSVVGMVNMNETTIDLSNVENVKLGDEVILIGKQGDVAVSVSSFSDQSDQLNYEFLSQLPKSITRKIVE